jgi:uncharacterized protein DUF4255/IPT/TIG domain-containing protein
MSSPWAIAAVTETVVHRLNGIPTEEPTLGPLKVSFGPPDRARTGNAKPRQLNLFLYQVAPNAGWSNQELPVRDGDGFVLRQPVLAIDLRYLLTAYGDADDEQDAQHVLGHAMSVLHDDAILGRDAVRDALDAAGPPIRASDLDKQVEVIKLSPERLTDEDLFRMWTVFGSQYRISVGYHASVVLLERPRTVRRAPPALEARLMAVTLRTPVIERIEPAPAHAGDTLTVRGQALRFDDVTLRFQDVDVTVPPADVQSTSVSVPVPASLRAGPNTVQVIGSVELPDGAGSRRFASSDVAAFVLAPRITTAIPAGGVAVARGADLTLSMAPDVARTQRVSVLVGDSSIARTVGEADPDTASSAVFRIPGAPFPTGARLLRVVVDGAESALEVDTTPGSPTEGQFVGPLVKIT